nr:glycosyltransferase [Streptomyces californicus]
MRAPAGAPPVAVAVVIPARDEEALLPAALASVRAAAGHPGVGATPVLTVVVADTCTDATAAVARAAGAQVVPVGFRNVGRSRAAGVLTALSFFGDVPGPVWIASTDADSTVRPDWLAHQLARAAEGWDAVVGTVTADRWPPGKPHLAARYHRLYETTRPPSGRPWHHPHVHGANLGVGSRAYNVYKRQGPGRRAGTYRRTHPAHRRLPRDHVDPYHPARAGRFRRPPGQPRTGGSPARRVERGARELSGRPPPPRCP